jgi:plasmid stabilization system protein ParE
LRVRLSRQAQADGSNQLDWLTEHSPSAALKSSRRLFDAISLLADFPLSGKATRGSERELPVRFGRDGFIIRYEARPTEVFVKRIFHSRQDRG